MKLIVLFLILITSFYFSIPKINQELVKHDWLIIPKNILKKKNPLVKSISDLEVIHTKGSVYYLRNNETHLLSNHDKLILGDVLYVKSNGFVILHYAFDSKIKVNPNTIVKITDLKKNLDHFDHSKLNTFTLELGSILVDYPKHSEDISMLVKTRRASMGVRGTQFLAALGVQDQSLRVAVDHGLIELNSLKKDTHVEVSSGQGAMINAVGKMQEPGTAASNKWVKAIDWKQEEVALESPAEYEKIHDNQEEIKENKRKELIEQVKNFKASGNTITNDNLNEAIKNVNESGAVVVAETQNEDEGEIKVETGDLSFLKKINVSVLAKFAAAGLIPNQLSVAMEEIKGVEENNKKRIEELDLIEEKEH